MSASFRRMAKVTASTKRPPAIDPETGQRGDPEPHLVGVKCLPLDPAETQVARDLAFRLQQETGRVYSLLQTFTEVSNDITEGDVLVVAGREYAVRTANTWTWGNGMYLHFILEDVTP